MPTWKRRNPDHQPLKCDAGFHLWHHGLALAIYNKAGALTKGDKDKDFFANRETLAVFYKAHPNSVSNAMNFLLKRGWLEPTDVEKHYKYVNHDKWAFLGKNAEQCVSRDLVAYQEEADPFVGKLFAIAHGSLRLKEHWVVGVRKVATDEQILEAFAEQRRIDIARRKNGDGHLTGPTQSFYAVTQKLKALANKKSGQKSG